MKLILPTTPLPEKKPITHKGKEKSLVNYTRKNRTSPWKYITVTGIIILATILGIIHWIPKESGYSTNLPKNNQQASISSTSANKQNLWLNGSKCDIQIKTTKPEEITWVTSECKKTEIQEIIISKNPLLEPNTYTKQVPTSNAFIHIKSPNPPLPSEEAEIIRVIGQLNNSLKIIETANIPNQATSTIRKQNSIYYIVLDTSTSTNTTWSLDPKTGLYELLAYNQPSTIQFTPKQSSETILSLYTNKEADTVSITLINHSSQLISTSFEYKKDSPQLIQYNLREV
jgi:hypothetical protein